MVAEVDSSTLAALEAALLNKSGTVPLHNRFRALFTLKSLKNDNAVTIISKGTRLVRIALRRVYIYTVSAGFEDESALLKHELAYCLGQIKNKNALPVLEAVLANATEDPMVRHEVRKLSSVLVPTSDVRLLYRQRRLSERYPTHRLRMS